MLGEIYRVTMIGHRIVENFDIEEKLYDLFKNMLRTKKYVEFYLGRNGDFDILAASVIKRLQKNYRNDNSALILVLPYPVKDYEYYEKYYDEMAVLLLASISGTIAYIQVHSHISNSFTVAKLSIELNETFDGKDKTNVTVENTGDVPTYLRAAIVVNWKDTDGTVISANESEYSMAMGPEWIQGTDSYWYCKKPTDAGQPSLALIVICKPKVVKADQHLGVEILIQGVQAEPATAVEELWDATVTADGTLTPAAKGGTAP